MVLAHHLIWTGYGWWLPNDPRGSGSHVIHNDVLKELGEIHYGRKRVQPPGRVVREFYEEAHQRLKHEAICFDADDIRRIADSFAEIVNRHGYTCYACAIMPDHVHILIRKHRDRAEDMIARIQSESREPIIRFRSLPQDHWVWTNGGWKVFLDTPDDIRRTIRYIEENPVSARLTAQNWPFVVEYDGWPFHKQR